MTTEGTASLEPADDSGALRCYRHPDRETWVRCGRCDRPICPRCAMQGPVGIQTASFVASLEGVPGGAEPFMGQYLVDQGLWAALAAAITAAGAWFRLR